MYHSGSMRLMKKFFIISLLFIIMVFSSACHRSIYTIKIDKDNNISFSYIYALKNKTINEYIRKSVNAAGISSEDRRSMIKELNKYTKDESMQLEYIKNTYSYLFLKKTSPQLYKLNGYRGFIQSKDNIKMEDFYLSYLPAGFTNKNKHVVDIEAGFVKNKYRIHLNYSYIERDKLESYGVICGERKIEYKDDGTVIIRPAQDFSSNESEEQSYVEMSEKPEEKFIIQLPVKAKKHNATSVLPNNTYEWDLFTENPNLDIYIEYDKGNGGMGIILIFLFLIIGFIAIGYMYLKSVNDVSI